MKKGNKNKIFKQTIFVCLILVFCIVASIGLSSCALFSNETNPYIEDLSITIKLNKDGSADINETHKVKFSYREDDWWNYYKVISLYDNNDGNTGSIKSEITNLGISVDGLKYPISGDISSSNQLNNFDYLDISKYAEKSYRTNSSTKTEIGVIMPTFSSGTRTINISYRLSNFMVRYADCDGVYYKFVDESNTMSISKFYAKVIFLQAVESIDDVAIWTHIDNGNAGNYLNEETLSYVEYKGENVPEGTYLETRILLKGNSYDLSKYNTKTFDEVVEQENAWREKYEKEVAFAYTMRVVDYVLCGVIIAVGVLILLIILKKIKPKTIGKYVYIRDIPSDYTAGEALPIYSYYGKTDVADGISATLLDLFRKKYIDIGVGDKKKEATIKINRDNTEELFNTDFSGATGLREHEDVVLKMLERTAQLNGGEFTMKEMEKIASKNYTEYARYIKNYEDTAKSKTAREGCYPPKDGKNILAKATKIGFALMIIAIVVFVFGNVIGDGWSFSFTAIGLFVAGLIIKIGLGKKKMPLTAYGQDEHEKMQALGRFMEEFSKMDEHTLPELVMWEEYMVYATAMGIADKVSEQLEIKYPEYREMVMAENHYVYPYSVLYICSPSFRIGTSLMISNTIHSVHKNVNAMVKQANARQMAKKFGGGSGGSIGGGSGFSGGGGGFGGGGMGSR